MLFSTLALSSLALARPAGLTRRLVEHRPQFREAEAEDADHDAVRVEVKAFVKDKAFDGHEREVWRNGDRMDRFDERPDDRVVKEGEDDDKDAVRVEVKAFIKEKDLDAHREMRREGDRMDRFDDLGDDRVVKEGEDDDKDAVRVEVKALIKDKDLD